MLNIKGRQTPLFSLSQLKTVSLIAEKLFSYETVPSKNISPFDLLSTVRINEINRKAFQADNENFFINVNDYCKKLKKIDFVNSVKKIHETNVNKEVSIINLNNNFGKSCEDFGDEIIIDFQNSNKLPENFPSGDYLCLFNKNNIPLEIECFLGFSADIKIQTRLDVFEEFDVSFEKVIGYIKFQNYRS